MLGKPDSGKQTVLIIDDLDRIDPEHVFRILNVFAAHFDLDENANKFGFDRVIVVCDIQNVRRMFRTRYGQDTDFSGYIDKFYSRRVFHFDNRKAVEEAVSRILCSVKIEPQTKNLSINLKHQLDHQFVVFVLVGLLKVNALNLRSLWRMIDQPFAYEETSLHSDSYNCSAINLFNFLSAITGDTDSLLEGLQRCVLAKIGNEYFDNRDRTNKHKLGFVIPILSYRMTLNEEHNYTLPGSDEKIAFTLIETGERLANVFAKVRSVTKNDTETTPDIFPYLVEAVEVLQRLGHLR
jgi:hypothetical protein